MGAPSRSIGAQRPLRKPITWAKARSHSKGFPLREIVVGHEAFHLVPIGLNGNEANAVLIFARDGEQMARESALLCRVTNEPQRLTAADVKALLANLRTPCDLDALACPRCGARMRLLATIDDPLVIEPISAHLGLPTDRVRPDPAQPPPPAAPLFSDAVA
jgi:hypothetical protein